MQEQLHTIASSPPLSQTEPVMVRSACGSAFMRSSRLLHAACTKLCLCVRGEAEAYKFNGLDSGGISMARSLRPLVVLAALLVLLVAGTGSARAAGSVVVGPGDS